MSSLYHEFLVEDREFKDYDDFKTRDRLNLLACLIAERCLDFKIVEPLLHKGSGMYHEKVGLIEDKDGNVVAFSGSMNESGNSVENNYESFDVFCSETSRFPGVSFPL